MDIIRARKILSRIQKVESDIETLEDVRINLATAEFVSATLSSGGGSKSYTRNDVGKVNDLIKELKRELKNLRKLLRGEDQIAPNSIYTIYV